MEVSDGAALALGSEAFVSVAGDSQFLVQNNSIFFGNSTRMFFGVRLSPALSGRRSPCADRLLQNIGIAMNATCTLYNSSCTLVQFNLDGRIVTSSSSVAWTEVRFGFVCFSKPVNPPIQSVVLGPAASVISQSGSRLSINGSVLMNPLSSTIISGGSALNISSGIVVINAATFVVMDNSNAILKNGTFLMGGCESLTIGLDLIGRPCTLLVSNGSTLIADEGSIAVDENGLLSTSNGRIRTGDQIACGRRGFIVSADNGLITTTGSLRMARGCVVYGTNGGAVDVRGGYAYGEAPAVVVELNSTCTCDFATPLVFLS